MQESKKQEKFKKRKRAFEEVVEAYGMKFSWLGAQAAREMLISAATYNIEKNMEPSMRYRTHIMLAWERGWLKSTMMGCMKSILGDSLTSSCGKISDAALRGSTSGGNFSPPKVLNTPIMISTEFGQTDWNDELLNVFLALTEEGKTNIALNKIASMPEQQKKSIEKEYEDAINFREQNEFDLKTNFVMWGATYDPSKLEDDALRSRFHIVTPAKPLTGNLTEQIDKGGSLMNNISKSTIRTIRRELESDMETKIDYDIPSELYEQFSIIPRESRDIKAYMAARNWWGLEVNPEIMKKFIENLKASRRRANMTDEEMVFDLIFDDPHTYSEIMDKTGLTKQRVYKIVKEKLEASKNTEGWVVYSRDDEREEEDEDDKGGIFS